MRGGGERRLRHDVGAKAKTVSAADKLRELSESQWLLKHAQVLVDDIARQGPGLDDQALGAVAHELVRRALLARK